MFAMNKFLLLLIFMVACTTENSPEINDFTTHFEKTNGTETPTYEEVIEYWEELSKTYNEINIQTIGETDSGHPLHLITLNPDGNFDFDEIRRSKRVILINNGIHPGESDGIDATMLLFRDIVQGKVTMPEKTVLAAIPLYNIGGALNRNSGTRANQNGPKEYGFRGNARNYDLNRDFVKSDTKNARAFAKIYHLVKPDVFIDNHVSNGADYQYTLTHLFSQHNKLGGELGDFIENTMRPELEQKLAEKDWDITPYVNVFGRTPESGFSQFMDYPRYSSGYTTMFNTLGMMVETHMLKPYKSRVEGTFELMKSMLEITEERHEQIKSLRDKALKVITDKETYAVDWQIDSTKSTILNFKGFEGEFIPSQVTGERRLKYYRDRPYTKEVTYKNHFIPKLEVEIPKAYVIPKVWHNVIDLLKLNNIQLKKLEKDSTLNVESYKIEDYKTRNRAYEGHYPHYGVILKKSKKEIAFKSGDYIAETNQEGIRYLLETLEPQAPDSFFNWNFFDTILQQKEHFSTYVFEDTAKELLDEDPNLKSAFENKKTNDESYEHSKHYEAAHLQYPIYRIN
jgi:hypothetical protein